jgi:PAS domain S-box-containing protein
MPFLDLLHPKYRKASLERQRRKIKGAIMPGLFEMSIIRKDGIEVPIELTSAYTMYKGKRATVAYIRDITERKRVERALRESERKYRKLYETAPVMLHTLDKKGILLDCNKAFLETFGRSKEEMIGKPIYDFQKEESRKLAPAALAEVARKGTVQGERDFITKDGKVIRIGFSAHMEYDDERGETVIKSASKDITERKRTEEEIKNLARFPSENPNPVLRVTRNGTILYANAGSTPVLNVWKCDTRKSIPKFCQQYVIDVLTSGLSKEVDVDIGASTFTLNFVPVAEEGYVNIYGHDITEHKQAEATEKQLQQELQLASRLATVGEMAAGIAHEINNPLTGVIGFAQLLMKKDIPDDVRGDVHIIYEGAQRVASITRRLLTFARRQEQELAHININDVIETTLAMRAYEMESSNIKVTTKLDPELPWTIADASQLQQVFLNIILNAETEMITAHSGGNLLIKTERIDNAIRVSIKDDGPGIARKNLGKIFDPFFTTRDVGKGAGLGLSVCHGIITGHGGKIYAESKLGKGATFIVELPIVTKAKQLKLAEPAAEPKRISGARILVVDDDTIVQQFLAEILSEEEHEVEIIENGDDALERLKSEDYDVILLDVKLPGISGIEIYKHLQKRTKSVAGRVIFITGDVMGKDTMAFLSRTRAPYITKPFDAEQLKKDINRILSQQP